MIDLSQWRIRIGLFACCQSCGASKATAAAATGCTKGVRAGSALLHSQSSRPKLILSIACIFSLLLVVSGNVERNPGPTINDKPTRDGLIELLSSSKFTAGTWEQFACCLPNMTQEIIADIKQREPDNPMSAVAQHWLDNSTDPTWNQVIDALEEANESNLFMKVTRDLHVLESAVSAIAEREATTEVEKAFRILKEALRKHYANLNQLTRNCIDTIADRMYSENLVTESVRRSPSYSSVYDEFLAMLRCQPDISSLECHCQLFLDCLIAEGGPAQKAAESLAEDWGLEKLRQDSELTKEVYSISSKDQIAQDLKRLPLKFASLLSDIKKYYRDKGKYKVIDIAQWLRDLYDVPGLTEAVKIDDVFEKVRSYYDFMNCELIEHLVEKFPINRKLHCDLKSYVTELKEFEDSVQLRHLKETIGTALEQKSFGTGCDMVIKLTDKCAKLTLCNLRKVMESFFGDRAKKIRFTGVGGGSITIQYQVIPSQAESLILIAKAKARYMHHFGIFQMIINQQPIIDEKEDTDFSYEKSLLHSIQNIDSDREYEKIVVLLMDLEINLNHQSDEKALMVADAGERYQIIRCSQMQSPVYLIVHFHPEQSFVDWIKVITTTEHSNSCIETIRDEVSSTCTTALSNDTVAAGIEQEMYKTIRPQIYLPDLEFTRKKEMELMLLKEFEQLKKSNEEREAELQEEISQLQKNAALAVRSIKELVQENVKLEILKDKEKDEKDLLEEELLALKDDHLKMSEQIEELKKQLEKATEQKEQNDKESLLQANEYSQNEDLESVKEENEQNQFLQVEISLNSLMNENVSDIDATGVIRFPHVSKAILDIESLDDLLEACQECSANWKPIGLYLGLNVPHLERIATATNVPEERLQKVLFSWLNMDSNPVSPDPSWFMICNAIAERGQNPALAEVIAKEHPVSADEERDQDSAIDTISTISWADGVAGHARLCSCGKCSLQKIMKDGCPYGIG